MTRLQELNAEMKQLQIEMNRIYDYIQLCNSAVPESIAEQKQLDKEMGEQRRQMKLLHIAHTALLKEAKELI